jgi:hypothetical protein
MLPAHGLRSAPVRRAGLPFLFVDREPNPYFTDPRTYMLRVYIAILFGALLIALGGFLTTWGWGERSSIENRITLARNVAEDLARRRRAVLDALRAELALNLAAINDPRFFDTNPKVQKKYVMFPRFRVSALHGALISDVFNRPQDRALSSSFVALADILDRANRNIDLIDDDMRRDASSIPGYRSWIGTSKWHADVSDSLTTFSGLLASVKD